MFIFGACTKEIDIVGILIADTIGCIIQDVLLMLSIAEKGEINLFYKQLVYQKLQNLQWTNETAQKMQQEKAEARKKEKERVK